MTDQKAAASALHRLRPIPGGEGGIRTRGGFTLTRFPIVRIRPDYATSPQSLAFYHTCPCRSNSPALKDPLLED